MEITEQMIVGSNDDQSDAGYESGTQSNSLGYRETLAFQEAVLLMVGHLIPKMSIGSPAYKPLVYLLPELQTIVDNKYISLGELDPTVEEIKAETESETITNPSPEPEPVAGPASVNSDAVSLPKKWTPIGDVPTKWTAPSYTKKKPVVESFTQPTEATTTSTSIDGTSTPTDNPTT